MRYKNCKVNRIRRTSAREYIYELENGKSQIEFWSYSTPMIIKVDGKVYLNENTYSNTTRRHLSEYCNENGINRFSGCEFRTENEIRNMCM